MGWHTNMTGEEIMAEARKEREREISKLRALARHYNAEADRLERIEAVARAIADQNGDQWEFVPEDKPDWIDNRGMFQGRSRDINEPFRCDYEEMATAALHAVYEALKEPSEEMITTGDDAIDECVDFYDNAFGSGYTVEGRASRSTWQAMLSASALSSPLGEE